MGHVTVECPLSELLSFDCIFQGENERQSRVLDIEKLVRERAWKVHNKGRRKWCTSQCRQKNKVTLELDWSDVKFIPETPKYDEEDEDESILPTDTDTHIVFTTVFENNSESAQEQTLKAERSTTATCTSSITKGYSINGNINLTLKAPQVVEKASVGFSKGFTIQNVIQNQEQHTLTWSTEGKLVVSKNSKVTAKLQVKETRCNYRFNCRVVVQGKVKGTFYDYKRKTVGQYTGSMRTILLEEMDAQDAREFDNAVYLNIEGKGGFQYGIEQNIVID